jgi:anti-sigma factor RsiW
VTCRGIEPILAQLASSEGTPRIALDAARHLSRCSECAATLLRMRELNGLLDHIPKVDVPSSFTRRVMRAVPGKVRWGGGALILVAAAAGWTFYSRRAGGSAPWPNMRAPFESGLAMIAALFDLMAGVTTAMAAALDSTGLPPLRIPSLFPASPTGLLLLCALAILILGASGVAFSGGVLVRLRERRGDRSIST